MIAEYHSNMSPSKSSGGKRTYAGVKNEFSAKSIVDRWSKKVKVSESALLQHISGKYTNDALQGRPSGLDSAAKMQLASAIEDAQTGAGGLLNLPGLQAVMGAVAKDAGAPFANGVPGEQYALQIARTIPDVHTARGIPTVEARLMASADTRTLGGFFEQLQKIRDLYPELTTPECACMWGNFDESGFDLKITGTELVFWIKRRYLHFNTARTMTMASGSCHVSMLNLILGNTDPSTIPNGYIVAGENVQSSWFSPNPNDSTGHAPYPDGLSREHFLQVYYSVSASGMNDQALSEHMLATHFFPLWRAHADKQGISKDTPGVFFPDFPESHRPGPLLIAALLKYNIILATQPHNSSTVVQWLDLQHYGVLKPAMKLTFKKLASVLRSENSYLTLNKRNEYIVAQRTKAENKALSPHMRSLRTRTLGFNTTLCARTVIQWAEYNWKKYVLLPHTIEAGRRSGILPFNPRIVLDKFKIKCASPADARKSVRLLQEKCVQDFQLVCASSISPAEKLERIKQMVKELPDFSSAMQDGINNSFSNILILSCSHNMFVLLLLAIAKSSAAPALMIVAQAVPLTPDEEARRIVYNIIHNKAFVNLDMRAYTGKELNVFILARYEEEWAKVQNARTKAGRPSVPVNKAKKPKKLRSEAPPRTPSLPASLLLVSAPPTVM